MRADEVDPLLAEAQLIQDGRHAFSGKRLTVRVKLTGLDREVVLVQGAAALESVVPDIERLQLASHALFDELCHLAHLRGTAEGVEESLNLVEAHLHILVEGHQAAEQLVAGPDVG